MYFTFKKNNQQTKKPVKCFLHDGARANVVSADLYCDKTLPNAMEWNLDSQMMLRIIRESKKKVTQKVELPFENLVVVSPNATVS